MVGCKGLVRTLASSNPTPSELALALKTLKISQKR